MGVIFLLAIIIICLVDMKIQKNGIAIGNIGAGGKQVPEQWQNIIASDLSSQNIILEVDGDVIDLQDQELMMDADMSVYIPASIFHEIFQCAFNFYNHDNITMQKGNTVVKIATSSEYIAKDDEKIFLKNAYRYYNDRAYINAHVLEKAFGYLYKWDSSEYTLKLINNKKAESILPSKYSYQDVGRLSIVKNQGAFSTCWAFASLSAMETSLLPEEQYTFSVDNMALSDEYTFSQNIGGDYTRAIAYLTAWNGPVLDSDDEYGDGSRNADAKPVKHVQEVQILESKNLEAIKKAVFLYGGVESSLYTSMSYSDETSMFYNEENASYCYIGTKKPNHDTVIVGWDDNYPKSNFNVELEGNGAFLCMNSWGSNFGDKGLFYVSYYDSNIGIHNVVYTGIEDVDNYDHIYQSDLRGWIGQLGYDTDTAYFSNVYTAESNESLQAVGFYATEKNTSYEVYYVDSFEDVTSFDNKVYLQSGTFVNSGYYTVKLNDPIGLVKGKKYGIVIKITTPDSVHPIAIEYRAGRSTQDVILDDGEGYISLTGKSWEHVEESKSCNICLKFYTRLNDKDETSNTDTDVSN